MSKLFSYVIKFDTGAAPNPFWGLCTLTICKPIIRRTAKVGDWILGFGSTQVEIKGKSNVSYSGKLVYAMKVKRVLTLQEYDEYCLLELPNKIPVWKTNDWRIRLGDCVYHFSGTNVLQRKSVHQEKHISTDLGGINALLSDHFYYFGSKAIEIPSSLIGLIHKGRGHRIISEAKLIFEFETWLNTFKKNKIYGDPQYRHKYDKNSQEDVSAC